MNIAIPTNTKEMWFKSGGTEAMLEERFGHVFGKETPLIHETIMLNDKEYDVAYAGCNQTVLFIMMSEPPMSLATLAYCSRYLFGLRDRVTFN